MSVFYDEASLVVVPSGYKSGKIYAQKPLTTDGQLTFTRASTATRVNASGLIEAVASGVPRLDYLGSTCPKLLLEPQRTNSQTYSEQIDNAAWGLSGVSVSANNAISPDGNTNADKIVESAASARHEFYGVSASFSGNNAVSFFAKAAGRRYFCALEPTGAGGATFDLQTGTVATVTAVSASIENYGNGWYRCSVIINKSATSQIYYVLRTTSSVGIETYTGDGTSGVLFYGAQTELGASYPTSYIPTTSAAVTRLADAASKTGISSLIGQTEGTVFFEVDYSTLSGLSMFLSIRPDASNKVEVYRDGGTIYGELSASSSFSITATKAVGTHKIAFAYKSGSSALYIDGVLAGASTTSFSFTSSLVDFAVNARSGGSFNESANYKQLLLFKTRLTNAQLAELTTL